MKKPTGSSKQEKKLTSNDYLEKIVEQMIKMNKNVVELKTEVSNMKQELANLKESLNSNSKTTKKSKNKETALKQYENIKVKNENEKKNEEKKIIPESQSSSEGFKPQVNIYNKAFTGFDSSKEKQISYTQSNN